MFTEKALMAQLTVLLLIAGILVFAGCGKKGGQLGQEIPGNIQAVKLKDIVNNPQEYKDKEVVLVGNFGGADCAEDFIYKEGLDMVEARPRGFKNPKANKGKPIKLYGLVRVVERGVINDEGSEEASYEVYIDAKGVEIK